MMLSQLISTDFHMWHTHNCDEHNLYFTKDLLYTKCTYQWADLHICIYLSASAGVLVGSQYAGDFSPSGEPSQDYD